MSNFLNDDKKIKEYYIGQYVATREMDENERKTLGRMCEAKRLLARPQRNSDIILK